MYKDLILIRGLLLIVFARTQALLCRMINHMKGKGPPIFSSILDFVMAVRIIEMMIIDDFNDDNDIYDDDDDVYIILSNDDYDNNIL